MEHEGQQEQLPWILLHFYHITLSLSLLHSQLCVQAPTKTHQDPPQSLLQLKLTKMAKTLGFAAILACALALSTMTASEANADSRSHHHAPVKAGEAAAAAKDAAVAIANTEESRERNHRDDFAAMDAHTNAMSAAQHQRTSAVAVEAKVLVAPDYNLGRPVSGLWFENNAPLGMEAKGVQKQQALKSEAMEAKVAHSASLALPKLNSAVMQKTQTPEDIAESLKRAVNRAGSVKIDMNEVEKRLARTKAMIEANGGHL